MPAPASTPLPSDDGSPNPSVRAHRGTRHTLARAAMLLDSEAARKSPGCVRTIPRGENVSIPIAQRVFALMSEAWERSTRLLQIDHAWSTFDVPSKEFAAATMTALFARIHEHQHCEKGAD